MPRKAQAKKPESSHERAIWRGTLSFGLVQIPVGLYRAESNSELHFTMLDKRSLRPVHFERKSEQTGKAIKWSDIVKGYEIARNDYVVVTEKDFEAASVKATGEVDILDFVDAEEIDPLYYSKPYYLLPQGKGVKTYVLLRESLRRANKVGVAKIVLRTRQHLALVRVYDQALVLELLRFPHELRPTQELQFPGKGLKDACVSEREVKLANALVDSMTGSWNPQAYRDDYHDRLLKVIERKRKAGKSAPAPVAKKPTPGRNNVVDIVELLQRSMSGKKAGVQGPRGRSSKASAAPKVRASARRPGASGQTQQPKSDTKPKGSPSTKSTPGPRPKAVAKTRAKPSAGKRSASNKPTSKARPDRGR